MAGGSEESSAPLTRVAIGVVRRGPRFLVRRRPPGAPLAGFWEFPGGKCEPGESPEVATVRECYEEAGLRVVLGPRRRLIVHRYPHARLELHFFDAEPCEVGSEPSGGSGFLWVAASELRTLNFPEANTPLLEELVREFAGMDV